MFDLNLDYKVVLIDNEVAIIDDWYKDYDQIIDMLKRQTPAPYRPDSNVNYDFDNGVKYKDCRLDIPNTNNETLTEIEKIIGEKLTFAKYDSFTFNYWKNIEVPSNNYQSIPHIDSHDFALACVIYMDTISSGGTQLYDAVLSDVSGTGLNDISKFQTKMQIKPRRLLEAKPNRLVIYPGNLWHGAFIEDHSKYVDDWRINQVNFMRMQ